MFRGQIEGQADSILPRQTMVGLPLCFQIFFIYKKADIADIATVYIEFKSALKAHISVSWLHPFKEQKLVVVGQSGMAVFDDTKPWNEKLALYRHIVQTTGGLPSLEKAEVEYLEVPQSEPLRNECQHFINVVSENVAPLTNGEEGLSVLKVLSAASLSESKKEAVKAQRRGKSFLGCPL